MNMYYMASMYGQSGTSSKQTTVEMDTDRYFKAVLNGPESKSGRVPTLRIIYALPKGE